MELDETDVRILQLLQADGRLSFREIAKKTGASTPTISSRVRKLEEQGVIRGYHADINPQAVNETLSVLTIQSKPKELQSISELLRLKENVREIMVLSGSKVMARVVFENESKLEAFLHWLEGLEQIDSYTIDRAVRMVKKKQDAIVTEGIQVIIPCYLCRKPIRENPVTLKMDGRTHYLCCNSCLKLYTERYEKLKKATESKRS